LDPSSTRCENPLKYARTSADKYVVRAIRSKDARVFEDERGYTLPEILTAVSIMSIILAIGIIVLLALLERWRVEAAADQFAADLRLAHTRATEQLTDWRVVFMHDGTPLSRCSSADYCMVKLDVPYGAGDPTPGLADDTPLVHRELPDWTKIKEVTFDPDCSHGDRNAVVPPSYCGSGAAQNGATRTLEFNSNGTVRTLRPGQSGTVVISSEDGSPTCPVVFNAPTSWIRIGDITY
jgi:prepilin-type N-terminal cleavage/methylation domain-containing protein